MTNKAFTEDELRQWVLSLPQESIRSLEDTLRSIRDCHFKTVEREVMEGRGALKNKVEMMEGIDVSPPSRTTSPTSSNVSLQSRSKLGKTYENGRRNLKEEDVSTEEASRRAKRRERNRLAAAKCRKRRQDKIECLQHRVSQLKTQMEELTANIDQYTSEHDSLNSILSSHKCNIMPPNTHQGSAARPKDLKLETSSTQESSSSSGPGAPSSSSNVFICSLSPQLINLSPLFTPSTMKLLIDTINSQQSSECTPLKKEDCLQTVSSLESSFLTAISTPSNSFSQSLNLLNLMSPNSDLLNMNLLSSPSLKIAASLASTISAAHIDETQSTDQSNHGDHQS